MIDGDRSPPAATDPPQTDAALLEPRPIVRSFVRYLRHPRLHEPHDRSRRWIASLKLLGLDFLLLVPLSLLAALGEAANDNEAFTADEGLSAAAILALSVVVAPLLEESTFRLILTRFIPKLAIGVGVLMWFTLLVPPITLIQLALLAPGAALVVVGIVTSQSATTEARVGASWQRHFGWVFYGSALLFGAIHLYNYDLGSPDAFELAAAPLLIAPQIVGGLVLGYVRVRLGFWYAVANHAAFNGILWVLDVVGG